MAKFNVTATNVRVCVGVSVGVGVRVFTFHKCGRTCGRVRVCVCGYAISPISNNSEAEPLATICHCHAVFEPLLPLLLLLALRYFFVR